MSIKFGLRLPACEPARAIAKQAALAEAAGFDSVWVPDSQLLWRDAWITLSAVALATSKIGIGVGVTTPVTRHLTVTAGAITSLNELSDGRASLGIGQGDSSVRLIGLKPTKVAEMRDAIRTIRAFGAGQWVDFADRKLRMKSAEGRTAAAPIYLAATGPKMLQVAGEVADGAMLLAGVDRDNLDYAIGNVRTGAERAGRALGDLDLMLGAYTYAGADWREARRLARPYAALFAMHWPEALKAVGIRVPTPRPMPELYPDVNHCEDWDRAVALTDWVPDEVLDLFCSKYTLMGTAREIIAKLETVVSRGITHFYLLGFKSYELPTDVAQVFAKAVIPYFRSKA
jgi:5,10-methylenetetrahydromethanopterin reductase